MKKIILLFVLSTFSIYAQEGKKKADKYFATANFAKAADAYAAIVNEGTSDIVVLKRAADSYYYISKFENAEPIYQSLVTDYKEAIDDVYLFRYAQTLKALKKDKEADKWMKLYEKEVSDVVYKASSDKLAAIKKQGNKFEVKDLALNTANSDFGPAFYKNSLVYSAPAKTGDKYKWTNQPYLDLYTANILTDKVDSIAVPFSKELNSKLHEANVTFTKDGNTIYFTRNYSEKGKRKSDKNKITNLGIYKATLTDGVWTDIQPVAFNSPDFSYSTMHPSLNKDNTRLYFSSDMPGTIGSFDIFYVTVDESGNLGTPVNLGPEINTKNRDQFPYSADDNRLYFASDGHPGFGLLDVFMCEYKDETFTKPLNVGLPVNTNADDFGFIIDNVNKKGFYASNREGGKGDDDIYGYLETKPVENFKYYVEGVVKDGETDKNIDNAVVTLSDDKGNILKEMTFLEAKTYRFDLEKTGTYKVSAKHPLYITAEKTFTVLDNGTEKNTVDIKMQKIPDSFLTQLVAEDGEPRVITDDGVLMFDLKEILFDYDKSVIRKDARPIMMKLIGKLKRYPQIKLEIGSHTDNRGSDEYNQKLSDDRAVSTKNFLIENGISGDRMTSNGYGETKPKVNCGDHECTEAEHQINRRSEFVILVPTKLEK